MNDTDRHILLSAVHVHWSEELRVFVARSDQFPTVSCRHESSLAAVNGLLDAIHQHLDTVPSGV
ncbi:hypothetical protein [Nocardia blacklockiae]|uniref:hypothetical protein n=1 Tax=Nocardia blacklockiae TaxID=480036 RepID=UPI0018941033|nr:hypothetical protein [Nocardia blacklockiae]MBF6174910.1 hypothetical protein [Nocardia blacklockiae]